MSDEIVFYDLPAKDGKAWSLNPWKTRLFLNYKNLPYRTQWTEYPDVEPVLKQLVPSNPSGSMANYTIPAVTLPDGTSIMDSLSIAKELDIRYPNPPLYVDDPTVSLLVTDLIPKATGPLTSIYVPGVPLTLLNPPSAAYFRRTREARYASTLESLRDDPEKGGAKAFAAAASHLDAVAALYRSASSSAGGGGAKGPFLRGEEISYADLVVVAWLKMFERLGVLEDLLGAQEGQGKGKELRALWDGAVGRGVLERDDH